jgi:hypothetical protein
MEFEIDTSTRNSIWKRLSRNISQSKLGEFARAVNRVFSSIKICRKSSKAQVPNPVSSAFVYPDDRYLCNDEILRQLELLERRFNQQTDILAKAQGKICCYLVLKICCLLNSYLMKIIVIIIIIIIIIQ